MIKPSVPDSLFVSTKEGCSGEALQSKVESPNAQNSFDSLHQPSEAALSSVHIQNKSTNSGDRKRLYSEISEESVEERKMFEDDDLLIKSLLGTLDPDDVFDEGEFVLAYFGDKIYHAQIKIRKLHDNRSEFTYFVHYPRWNSRWDEWMKADRLMKFTDENLKFMEQVNASKKNKKEKIQKHSNYERNSSTSKDINSDKKNSLGSNSELEKKSSKEIGDRVSLRSRRKLRRASDKLERRSVSKIRTRSHSEARNVLSSSSSSVNHPLNHPIEMESDMIKESENFPKIVPKPDKRESSNLSVTSLTNFCSPENFPFNKNTEMKIDGCAPYFEKMLDTPMKNSSKAGIDEVESKGIDYESKDDLQIISSRENEIKSHPDIFPIPLPKDKSDLLTSRHFFRKDETNGKIIGDSVNSNHSSRTLSEKNTSYLKLNPGVDEFLFREDIALPLSTLPPQPPFDLHLHLLTPLKIIDVHINKIDAEPSSVSKVILQLDIPDTLSDIALQNWESVTLNQKLILVPRTPNISWILDLFYLHSETCYKSQQILIDELRKFTEALKHYFCRCVKKDLLTTGEYKQYHTLSQTYRNNSPASLYGIEHLIRMLMKLPLLMENTFINASYSTRLNLYLDILISFLDENISLFLRINACNTWILKGSTKEKKIS